MSPIWAQAMAEHVSLSGMLFQIEVWVTQWYTSLRQGGAGWLLLAAVVAFFLFRGTRR
jgi:hypothetical protein